jgi:hypothetical protein
MQHHRTFWLGFAALSLFVGIAPNASAHHESWILKNAGASCAFENPDLTGNDYATVYLFNSSGATGVGRWMTCPVALSARWGSTSPSYAPTRWARAYSAIIYGVNNTTSNFTCIARATMDSDIQRFSQTTQTFTNGEVKLHPAFTRANGVSDWGGTLESFEGQTVRALDFQCQVPGNGSGVWGYKVRMCIRNAACGDSSDPDGERFTTPGGIRSEQVQTSGQECLSSGNSSIERGFFGIRNNGPWPDGVWCPITPSADDTNDPTNRLMSSTVYYKAGGSFGADPAPTCYLVARSRDATAPGTEETWSNAFTQTNVWEQFVSLQSFSVGSGRNDIVLGAYCHIGPGVTLQGIRTSMSVAPVAGGL